MKKRYFFGSIFIISLLIIGEYHLGRLNIGIDQLRQYEAAFSLYSGNGLTFNTINYDDLSNPTKKVLTAFPPGYSLFTAPLFYISNNIRLVNLIFTALNLFLFFYGSHKLIQILTKRQLRFKWISLAFFFVAINATFIILAAYSDLVCVNLFIFSAISLIKAESSIKPGKYIAFASLAMVLTVYFRYAYIPALFVIPLFFLIRTTIFKLHEWKKLLQSIGFTIISAVPFIGHIIYINMHTNYIQSKATTVLDFHWENWTSVSPFPLHGFFDIFPFLRAIGYASEYGYDRGYSYPFFLDIIFFIGSILIIIPIINYSQSYLVKRNIKSPTAIFVLFAIILSVSVISLVYVGSLINPSQIDAYNWSWVKIFRYFALPVYFIQITYLLIIYNGTSRFFKRFVLITAGLSILYNVSLKIYNYSANYRFLNFEYNVRRLGENDKALNSYQIHKFLLKEDENEKIVLFDQHIENRLYCPIQFFSINNATVARLDSASASRLHSTRPINLYILSDPIQNSWSDLIVGYDAKELKKFDNNISIYKLLLEAKK